MTPSHHGVERHRLEGGWASGAHTLRVRRRGSLPPPTPSRRSDHPWPQARAAAPIPTSATRTRGTATAGARPPSGTACWPAPRCCSPASSASSSTAASTPAAASTATRCSASRSTASTTSSTSLSGLLLLASSAKRKPAKTVALLFGVVYGVVTLIGLIDGETILGLIPVNPADNILHLALALTGILAAIASDADDRDRITTSTATGHADDRPPHRERRPVTERGQRFDRDGSDVDPLTGRPRSERV